MRYIKHFYKVAGYMIARAFCKHQDSYAASCPFTGMTYTSCTKCGKRLSVNKTIGESHGE